MVSKAILAPGKNTDPVVVLTPPGLGARGNFMATLTFRPFDGGEQQRLTRFADTEDYAVAEVYQALSAALGQVQTMAPDTPAVRIFINAASHVHDLRQALSALESAEKVEDTTVAAQLRIYAVIAYGRSVNSRVRPDLATFVELTPRDLALTERLKTIRNKYAAHSENSMTTTHPLLDLQKELDGSITIQQVSGLTVDTPMPAPFVAEFASMLRDLIEQLVAALQPLKDATRKDLTPEQLASVFSNPEPLQFVVAPVSEWEPSGRRPPYPVSRTSAHHLDAGEDGSLSISITR